MKEIISAVLFIVSLWGGTVVLKGVHDGIRKAALEKAAQGLPSLEGMTRALQKPRKSIKKLDHLRQKNADKGGPRDEVTDLHPNDPGSLLN